MNFFVKKFYEDAQEDESFIKKVLKAKKRFNYLKEPREKICAIIEKVILPIAEEKGYNFDIYDLLIFEEEASDSGARLMEESVLEKVSGGTDNFETSFPSAATLLGMGEVPLKGITDEYLNGKNKEI